MEQPVRETAATLRIAGVQMDVAFGDPEKNLGRIERFLRQAAENGAELVIFPECAVTGYCFDSLEEAWPLAQSVPGPATKRLGLVCVETGVYAVFGLLEADGERVFNTAVLVGPEGVIGRYRKVHLPYLGVDRYTTPGDGGFSVFAAGEVRVGMTICYDAAFPEASRVLALEGADLIVLPTNWPPGAECMADFAVNTRAMENAVYFAAVNRVGTERGFRFIGRSRICDPGGNTLAVAGEDETILYAQIEPERARRKRIVRVPDKHIIDRMADRRPEMYSRLTQPHDLAGPRARPADS
ncbi:MAG: carbon-nitrogen hydrolase family protein [Planctomycetes bacterium]|nr:carbon-nitrogen hydrolase family protein [Planctomycetota bacterium]